MLCFGVPASISVPLVALLVWMLTMSGSFQRIEKILLLVSCVFVTYIVARVYGRPQLGRGRGRLGPYPIIPESEFPQPHGVATVVATIGTTIAP